MKVLHEAREHEVHYQNNKIENYLILEILHISMFIQMAERSYCQ